MNHHIQTKDVRVRAEGGYGYHVRVDSFGDVMAQEEGDEGEALQRAPDRSRPAPGEIVISFSKHGKDRGPQGQVGSRGDIWNDCRDKFSVVKGRFKAYSSIEVRPKRTYNHATREHDYVEDEGGVVGELLAHTSLDRDFIRKCGGISIKL